MSKICKKCGKENEANAKFCNNCGAELNDETKDKLEVSNTQKKSNKKMIIFFSILILILLIGIPIFALDIYTCGDMSILDKMDSIEKLAQDGKYIKASELADKYFLFNKENKEKAYKKIDFYKDYNTQKASKNQYNTNETKESNSSKQEDKEENKINSISLGEIVTIDNLIEFTITEGNFAEKILPSNTSSAYSYYEDKPNEIYYVLKGTVKNLSGDTISVEFGTENNFTFNDNYNYTGTFVVEDNDGGGFSSDVTPLSSMPICIFVSVPYEIKDNFSKCEFKLGFDNMTTYTYKFEECKNKYSLIIE